MIRIIADSTSDLGSDLIRSHQIEIVPLTVILKEKQFKDGQDIQTPQLFDYVKQYGELPKTSAVSVAEFVQAYKGSDEIIYIGISSQLSASFHNAELAVREMEATNIHLVDSLNLSTGIGLLVLKAAELRDAGKSATEITQVVQSLVPSVRSSFVVDTLEYLYLGGRCSAITNLAGSVLQIRPVIEVRPDGTLGVKEKVRGSRARALQSLVEGYKRDLQRIDPHRVFITHTGCPQDAAWLEGELRKLSQPEEICITTAGAVIASHCGPNTIGILYLQKP
jgi:fatty acid kinase fatty acid binding subunit